MATRKQRVKSKPKAKGATRTPAKKASTKKLAAPKRPAAKKALARKAEAKHAPARRAPAAAPVAHEVARPPAPAPERSRRRVSIGEALAQLNAAALEGVTAELTPFGLSTEAALTPSPSFAALVGSEPRPLTALVEALETWGDLREAALEYGRRGSDSGIVQAPAEEQPPIEQPGGNLMLLTEATVLLSAHPRDQQALEGFVKRNCTL